MLNNIESPKSIEDAIKELAEQFSIDVDALKRVMEGTVELVQHAQSKGFEVTPEVIVAATEHHLNSMQKYHQKLMTNEDGEFDKLCGNVYDSLASS